MDANDIDAEAMQNEMNRHLLLLLEPKTKRTPLLSEEAVLSENCSEDFKSRMSSRRQSFTQIWQSIDALEIVPVSRTVRARRPSTSSSYSARSADDRGSLGPIDAKHNTHTKVSRLMKRRSNSNCSSRASDLSS